MGGISAPRKDRKSSKNSTKEDESLVKRFSQLEKNQTKRDEEISKQFANFSKMLEEMSRSKSSRGQQKEKIKNPSQAVKKNYSDLMELADGSEYYQSEDEDLYDSDMGREDDYGDQSQNKSEKESGTEEEDIIDIIPSQAKLFKPSTEQTEM